MISSFGRSAARGSATQPGAATDSSCTRSMQRVGKNAADRDLDGRTWDVTDLGAGCSQSLHPGVTTGGILVATAFAGRESRCPCCALQATTLECRTRM